VFFLLHVKDQEKVISSADPACKQAMKERKKERKKAKLDGHHN
jgi:hypothetical protein